MQGDPTAGSAFFMYITSILLVLVTADFCFVYLTYIVVVQTLNFANAQTTQARFKAQNAT